MIIKKIALLMLTMTLISAFAGKGSKQGEQIVTAVRAVTSGFIEAKVSYSDSKTQGIGLGAIRKILV